MTEKELVAILEKDEKVQTAFAGSPAAKEGTS
jgi:hypothetical protein